MSSPVQRQRHVDHRQAGADDQDRRARLQALNGIRGPGLLGRNFIPRGLAVVTGRQHHAIGLYPQPRRQLQSNAVGGFGKIDANILHMSN
jgi:hypothetical protein